MLKKTTLFLLASLLFAITGGAASAEDGPSQKTQEELKAAAKAFSDAMQKGPADIPVAARLSCICRMDTASSLPPSRSVCSRRWGIGSGTSTRG
jgi:uncharacterized membrane-anchored protein